MRPGALTMTPEQARARRIRRERVRRIVRHAILLLFIFSILIFFGVYMLISQRRAVEGSAP